MEVPTATADMHDGPPRVLDKAASGRSEPPRATRRIRDRTVVLASLALCLALRAPWLNARLEIDEGGLATIGKQLSLHGPQLYGRHFLDRPPLLPLLYGAAVHVGAAIGIGGTGGVRLLGALAALALVGCVAGVAKAVGGSAALRVAAPLTAALASARALDATFTDAELLAAVPAAASVWLLLTGSRARARERLAASGVLAACALLLKQSFLDPGLIGVGVLLARILLARTPGTRRYRFGMAATWGAAAASTIALAVGYAALTPVGARGLWYANFGFRTRTVHALQSSTISIHERLLGLVPPAAGSGIVVLLVLAAFGLWRLTRTRRFDAVVIAVWLLGMSIGVLGGGYYWPHYLIQAIAPLVVAASVGLVLLRPWARAGVLALIAASITAGATFATIRDQGEHPQATVQSVADFVRANRHVGPDTMDVLYARANLTWDADMHDQLPWLWTSMFRVEPDAQQRVRAVFTGSDRPTWLVTWQKTTSLGLDQDGQTAAVIKQGYRHVATICNIPVFVRRDRVPDLLVAPTPDCSAGQRHVSYELPVAHAT